ncbi:MAG: DUF2004 domain-containing protein [Crocinitomicaceae bacterium]|jgi:hypothetical protein|nr:DUF2004 domain-containing protein [Crocinitomicaceae bacterium]
MSIHYFNDIDPSQLEEYYSKEIELENFKFELDLNFESQELSKEGIIRLNRCLTELPTIIKNSWAWIMDDYKNGEDVAEYISIHLDDFFEDNPEEILNGTDTNLDNKERFLQTLRVNRIGLYPDSNENYVVIDWMTNPDLSNYILVVNCNEKLELEYITIES